MRPSIRTLATVIRRAFPTLSWATASSRAAALEVLPHERILGRGQDWAPTVYGEYYATSPSIYAATRVRAQALISAPLTVLSPGPAPTRLTESHPLAALLASPNESMVTADIISAIETHLCLWGKAYLTIEQVDGRLTIWPVRPDRLTALPGSGTTYVQGYLYRAQTGATTVYLPEEVVAFTYFNPMQDRTGMSPIAPLRLTADMARDASTFNRRVFQNGGVPDFVLFGMPELTDAQAANFYQRWEDRYKGPDKAHRPAIAAGITDMKPLAFSQREMEYLDGLRWAVQTTASVYGVPEPLLGRLENATLANVEALERILWRNTLMPETQMLSQVLTGKLLPKLGYPGYTVTFDLSNIEALNELEEPRLRRETAYLDRGVLTINEVRVSRGLSEVPWGNDPDAPAKRVHPATPFNQAQAASSNGHKTHSL
jgi:HK97 family phage portal protein